MKNYFHSLNYSLANEDTTIEYSLLQDNQESVCCVCGSGSRVLPLLAKNPKKMTIIDLSEDQLMLCRLRLSAAKSFDLKTFKYFMGYEKISLGHSRVELLHRLNLPTDVKNYWLSYKEHWSTSGFIYLGKWERHFMLFGKIFNALSFRKIKYIFKLDDEKIRLKKFPKKLFYYFLKIVLNPKVMNKMLYKGSYVGSQELKTKKVSAQEFVSSMFLRLIGRPGALKNFFLEMIFLQDVSSPPLECDSKIFEQFKLSTTAISYVQDSLEKHLLTHSYEFLSLSNTVSYMDRDAALKLMQIINQVEKQTVVLRSFLRDPLPEKIEHWWEDAEKNTDYSLRDCTGMYDIRVLSR